MAIEFNVLDEKTWQYALDKDFVWKTDTCFNEETGKQINEIEMIAFLRQLFAIIDDNNRKQKTISYGRDKVISFVLDSIFAKVPPEDIPSEVLVLVEMGIEPNLVHTVYQSMKKNDNNKGQIEISKNTTLANNVVNNNTKLNINYTQIVDDSRHGIFYFWVLLQLQFVYIYLLKRLVLWMH